MKLDQHKIMNKECNHERLRILVVAGQIYDEDYVMAGGHVTGLAVMLKDIYNGVSEKADCRILVTNIPLLSHKVGKMEIVSAFNGKAMYLQFGIAAVLNFIIDILKYRSIRKSKDKLLERKSRSLFIDLLTQWKPAVVNFHDFSYVNSQYIRECLARGIKCVVTLHLYVGKDSKSYGYDNLKTNEEDIMPIDGIYYSVVSSGIKKRILKDYPNIHPDNIYVIVNGSNFIDTPRKVVQRKKLLCIGSVCERKNQIQIVRAVKLMTEEERSKLQIIFLGEDFKGKLTKAIKIAKCGDSLLFKGKVPLSEMESIYENAFGTITTSLNEGFGLTIIEGYSRGIPGMFYKDLDSFEDLYSPRVAIGVSDHSDVTLKNSILGFISKEWNSEEIIDFSKRFSMKPVYDKYINMYRELSNETSIVNKPLMGGGKLSEECRIVAMCAPTERRCA